MRQPLIWWQDLQSIALAPSCVLCHRPASLALDLCSDCRAGLPRQHQACRHCAVTLPEGSAVTRCPICQQQPRFDAALAAFEYAAPVDWLITRLKFQARFSHARILGTLLAEYVAMAADPRPDCIVPVPLHKHRYRERGYNQAALLARRVGRLLDLPVKARWATRTRATQPQLSLPADQRRRNVRRAFTVAGNCAGRHVAIIDDVVTTGHTAGALAAALRRSGARSVRLWCVARA